MIHLKLPEDAEVSMKWTLFSVTSRPPLPCYPDPDVVFQPIRPLSSLWGHHLAFEATIPPLRPLSVCRGHCFNLKSRSLSSFGPHRSSRMESPDEDSDWRPHLRLLRSYLFTLEALLLNFWPGNLLVTEFWLHSKHSMTSQLNKMEVGKLNSWQNRASEIMIFLIHETLRIEITWRN